MLEKCIIDFGKIRHIEWNENRKYRVSWAICHQKIDQSQFWYPNSSELCDYWLCIQRHLRANYGSFTGKFKLVCMIWGWLLQNICVYPMCHKLEVLNVFFFFLNWKKMFKIHIVKNIKQLRSDNGNKYKLNLFMKVYQDKGIVWYFIVREIP